MLASSLEQVPAPAEKLAAVPPGLLAVLPGQADPASEAAPACHPELADPHPEFAAAEPDPASEHPAWRRALVVPLAAAPHQLSEQPVSHQVPADQAEIAVVVASEADPPSDFP